MLARDTADHDHSSAMLRRHLRWEQPLTSAYPSPIDRKQTSTRLVSRALPFLAPIIIGIPVSIASLILGADPTYVSLQLFLFVMLIPLIALLQFDDRYTSTVFLMSFSKLFYISQIICILIGRAPDIGLSRPTETVTAMIVGLLAGMAGIVLARATVAAAPKQKPLLTMPLTPERLYRLGVLSAYIGLPAQIGWSIIVSRLTAAQHGGVGQAASGLVVLSYLAPLATLSMCCFAAQQLMLTKGRTFFSRPFLLVFAIYLVTNLPLAGKAAVLNPVVAVFIVALMFNWKPKLGPLLAGLALFVFVSEFLYPVVTVSRLMAFGEGRPVPVVFAEESIKAVTDPSEFAYIRAYSGNYLRAAGQLYFGKSAGMFDRFTPLITDRLIVGAGYVDPPGAGTVLTQAALSVLPQALGFKRDITGAQVRVETAIFRTRDERGQVGWDNSGFIGDGYVSGGLGVAAIFMFIFGYISSLASRMTFGANRKNVFLIPFIIQFMFLPDGSTFTGMVPVYFWGWTLLSGGIAFLLHRMARRDPGILVEPAG